MGVSCKVGAFNTGTGAVNSTLDVTCGFQPKAIILWWSGHTSATDSCTFGNSKQGYGLVTQSERCCVTTTDDNGAGSQGSSTGHRDDACIASLTVNTTTWDGLVDIDALANWPSDGFRLIVDDVMPISLRVGFIAFGGTDITDVDLVRFQGTGISGNYDITIGGFQPDILFILGNYSAAVPPHAAATNGQIYLGYARTATEQAILLGGTDQGSASGDTAAYCLTGECAAAMDTADPGTISSITSFVSMLASGFRMSNVVTGATQKYALCIKGGVWKGGTLITKNDTTTANAISGLGGTPKGVLLASAGINAELQSGFPVAPWCVNVGAATGTGERHAQSTFSSDGTGNMRVVRAVEHDACLAVIAAPAADGADDAAGTIRSLMDVQSVDSDGFTFIMDYVLPGTYFAWWVMVGAAAPANPVVWPPSMHLNQAVNRSLMY